MLVALLTSLQQVSILPIHSVGRMTYPSPYLLPASSVKGGDRIPATPLSCGGTGLSRENGLDPGSTSRGEPFSANDCDIGRPESGRGNGFCLDILGETVGILDTCERNFENDGTSTLAKDGCGRIDVAVNAVAVSVVGGGCV